MIKNTDEQPDEEIHRVRSEKVPTVGASASRVGMSHTPHMWVCSTWKLSEPGTQTIDILDLLFFKHKRH